MKKVLISIVVIVLILVGSFYALNAYIYQEKQGNGVTEEQTPIVNTPAQPEVETKTLKEGMTKMIAPTVGIEFSYPDGQNGYVIDDNNLQMSVDPDFVKGYILTLFTDARELEQSTDAREGPPTIQLRVYNNPLKQAPSVWAMNHPLESNIELAIDGHQESVVGGANADVFKADGLYASDVYVVAHDSRIYVFTGAYSDENSRIVSDFANLLQSVVFIDESTAKDSQTAQ